MSFMSLASLSHRGVRFALVLATLPVATLATPMPDAELAKLAGADRRDFYIEIPSRPIERPAPIDFQTKPILHTFKAGEKLLIRINCGAQFIAPGWRFVEKDGSVWWADREYSRTAERVAEGHARGRNIPQWGAIGGEPAMPMADNVSDPRHTARNGAQRYFFILPVGDYRVSVRYLDTDQDNFTATVKSENGETGVLDIPTTKGRRLYAIRIEGAEPLKEDFAWEVGRQRVDTTFKPLADPGPVVARINVGFALPEGWEYFDGTNIWKADAFWREGADYGRIGGVGGEGYLHLTPSGPTPPAISRSALWGHEKYNIRIPDKNTRYTVRLHFSENFEAMHRPGLRVMDVAIQGETLYEGIDPFARGGGIARSSILELRGVDPKDSDMLEITKLGEFFGVEVFQGKSDDEPEAIWLTEPTPREVIPLAENAEILRVLHIGNSHTFFWAMPETIASMINASRRDIQILPYRYLRGGYTIARFFDSKQDAPIEEGGQPRILDVIDAGKFDYVVVQEAPQKNSPEYEERMRRVAEAVKKAGSKLVLYLPNDPVANDSEEEIYAFAREHDALIIPSGTARTGLGSADLPKGFVNRLPDGIHLSIHHGYLNKCLFWIALTGTSPEGKISRTLMAYDIPVDDTIAQWTEKYAWDFMQKHAERLDVIWGVEPLQIRD